MARNIQMISVRNLQSLLETPDSKPDQDPEISSSTGGTHSWSTEANLRGILPREQVRLFWGPSPEDITSSSTVRQIDEESYMGEEGNDDSDESQSSEELFVARHVPQRNLDNMEHLHHFPIYHMPQVHEQDHNLRDFEGIQYYANHIQNIPQESMLYRYLQPEIVHNYENIHQHDDTMAIDGSETESAPSEDMFEDELF